jgi:hypothetical protein
MQKYYEAKFGIKSKMKLLNISNSRLYLFITKRPASTTDVLVFMSLLHHFCFGGSPNAGKMAVRGFVSLTNAVR